MSFQAIVKLAKQRWHDSLCVRKEVLQHGHCLNVQGDSLWMVNKIKEKTVRLISCLRDFTQKIIKSYNLRVSTQTCLMIYWSFLGFSSYTITLSYVRAHDWTTNHMINWESLNWIPKQVKAALIGFTDGIDNSRTAMLVMQELNRWNCFVFVFFKDKCGWRRSKLDQMFPNHANILV